MFLEDIVVIKDKEVSTFFFEEYQKLTLDFCFISLKNPLKPNVSGSGMSQTHPLRPDLCKEIE